MTAKGPHLLERGGRSSQAIAAPGGAVDARLRIVDLRHNESVIAEVETDQLYHISLRHRRITAPPTGRLRRLTMTIPVHYGHTSLAGAMMTSFAMAPVRGSNVRAWHFNVPMTCIM